MLRPLLIIAAATAATASEDTGGLKNVSLRVLPMQNLISALYRLDFASDDRRPSPRPQRRLRAPAGAHAKYRQACIHLHGFPARLLPAGGVQPVPQLVYERKET